MNSILVEFYVPALGSTFDIYLPIAAKLHEVEPLIVKAVSELSDGYFVSAIDPVICDRLSGNILDIGISVQELNLYHGSRLMLI